jgi:L,D-peptidoglycan transpeptidase YkuD (ErfK/YbiS/YcfS/YnhG family)/very-short-patch-repair endonuclease
MPDIRVNGTTFTFRNRSYRCAIGKAGLIPAEEKREGDHRTPIGTWPLRECWYRADRLPAPQTTLPLHIITPNDAWCDDPQHALYNRHFLLNKASPLEGGRLEGGDLSADTVKQRSRNLRTSLTDAEQTLWRALRRQQLNGHTFRRQHPFGGRYIVDFICLEQKLVIELDGGHHAMQSDYDTARNAFIHQEGYRVMRFWNNDVMENLSGVLQHISSLLIDAPSPTLPPEGGGSAPRSFENLWREDHVYDLIIPLGYNDAPIVPGKGSAIFLHLARENYEGTEGCVALQKSDLLELLKAVDANQFLTIAI